MSIFSIFRNPSGLGNNLALCDCEAFKNSALPRLTWVGGTGEGWWEVDDFSRAFRRLSNLKMAICRSATTVRKVGGGERILKITLFSRLCISAEVRTNLLLPKVGFKNTSRPSQREACKAPIKTLARAHLMTNSVRDTAHRSRTPSKFCIHARRFSYLPLRRF